MHDLAESDKPILYSLDSWIRRPFRIQKSRRTKQITRAFNVPCFRVKVAKAKSARGFRIDHSAGPNCAPLPSQQQTNCHNLSNYQQSVVAQIPGARQEKFIDYPKIRLFFFLPRQSAVTRFPEFVQIKFL